VGRLPRAKVLEIGCRQGQNLVKLAESFPHLELFGIESSQDLLNEACKKVETKNFSPRIKLVKTSAEKLSAVHTFGLEEAFDVIFFSYSLANLPHIETAIKVAYSQLKPGGHLYFVDFFDMGDWPSLVRKAVQRCFQAYRSLYKEEIFYILENLVSKHQCHFEFESLAGRYSFLASVQKPRREAALGIS